LISPHTSIDFVMPDPEDQQVWSASLGLDLADRTVLEAEVLIWRILQQKSTRPKVGTSKIETIA